MAYFTLSVKGDLFIQEFHASVKGHEQRLFWIDPHETSLKELLTDSPYLDTVCTTLAMLKDANPECASCKYFPYCCGGCRAIGWLLSPDRNDMMGTDKAKCMFFKDGWYNRVIASLQGVLTPLNL